jgi:hypothetical protein
MGGFDDSTLPSILCKESRLFISWCAGDRCDMVDSDMTGATWWTAMRIMTGVGDLVQRTEDNQVHIGYSVTRKLGGRVMFCTVCTVHKETRSVSFLVWTQNQGRRLLLV